MNKKSFVYLLLFLFVGSLFNTVQATPDKQINGSVALSVDNNWEFYITNQLEINDTVSIQWKSSYNVSVLVHGSEDVILIAPDGKLTTLFIDFNAILGPYIYISAPEIYANWINTGQDNTIIDVEYAYNWNGNANIDVEEESVGGFVSFGIFWFVAIPIIILVKKQF